MKKQKQCNCKDYESCKADISCLYDFITIINVQYLETIIIEDVNYKDRITICYEHIPEIIFVLESIISQDKNTK